MKRYTDTISGEELYLDIDKYGNKFYYKDRAMKILHRTDGPAIERADGHKQWWVDNKLHRIDGPAFEYADGYKEWFVDNVFIMTLDKDGKIVARIE